MVLRVNGRVGLVEDGSTFFSPATLMMSRRMAAAGAFGVEGVNGAALERLDGVLDEARFVQRVGVDHHLDVVVVGDAQAVVDRGGRRAPVLVQLERAGAGLDHLLQRGGHARRCPCRRMPRLTGNASNDWIMRPMCHGPGVQVVAKVPCDGPVPPPSMVVTPDISASLDLLRADEMNVAVEAAGA